MSCGRGVENRVSNTTIVMFSHLYRNVIRSFLCILERVAALQGVTTQTGRYMGLASNCCLYFFAYFSLILYVSIVMLLFY